MIIAKTKMQKMPKTCKTCALSNVDSWTGDRICVVKNRLCPLEITGHGRIAYAKPSWCPLIETKEEMKR